jgi:hypothetical protein
MRIPPRPASRRFLLLALAAASASAALLDEQASTAPRAFAGGVARRASQPLLHAEEVPDWVRLTFADHYLGAARRSPYMPEEADEAVGRDTDEALEMLEENAAGPGDLFDAPLPHDHVHAVRELGEHHHAARRAHRRGRRRTHAAHADGERVHMEPIHEPVRGETEHERAAIRRRTGWGGGGVDAMVGLMQKHHPPGADAGDKDAPWPHGGAEWTPPPNASANASSNGARRPLPSFQGRTTAARPGGRQRHGHALHPHVAALEGDSPTDLRPFERFDFAAAPSARAANLTAIAEEAANRALRRHGLLETAPGPVSGQHADAGAGAPSFLERGAVAIDPRTGNALLPPPEHWEQRHVNDIIRQLGLHG